jgi:SAM-dependent methyltransferase
MIWTSFIGAPWVPSTMNTVQKMLALADLKEGELLYDLGCGDGRTVITAARKYGVQAVGIEIDPIRYLWCLFLISILGLRDQIQIHFGDFFSHDLSKADVVTCYLLPDTNKRLEDKLLRELKPGTRVVSNTYLFQKVIQADKNGDARLYIFSPENTIRESIKKQLIESKEK